MTHNLVIPLLRRISIERFSFRYPSTVMIAVFPTRTGRDKMMSSDKYFALGKILLLNKKIMA
jgi:hypothetical protein